MQEQVAATQNLAEGNIGKLRESFGAKEQKSLEGRVGRLTRANLLVTAIEVTLVVAGALLMLSSLCLALVLAPVGLGFVVFWGALLGGFSLICLGVGVQDDCNYTEELSKLKERLKALQDLNPETTKMQDMIREFTEDSKRAVLNINPDTKDDW